MARNVFFSFHYEADSWRAAQVRNIGAVEGNEPCSDNDWEAIKRGGDTAIKRWIDEQLQGTTCAVVLIGSQTAGRKWINYEIRKAWNEGKGVFGVYIHKLEDQYRHSSPMGQNPFRYVKVGERYLHTVVPAHNPPGFEGTQVYRQIKDNMANWIEQAIRLRNIA